MAMIVASAPSIAMAGTSYSALTWRAKVNVSGYGDTVTCLKARITTDGSNPVSFGGEIRVYDSIGNDCSGSRTLPAGWLGVTLDGYKSGAFCGTTNYYYSPSATWIYEIGALNLCSNPSGTQTFHTNVFGRVYQGSFYYNIPGISSPGQNG